MNKHKCNECGCTLFWNPDEETLDERFEQHYRNCRNVLAGERDFLKKENEKLRDVLLNSKETLEYVKQYVDGRGLSAEEDCEQSLELINNVLKEQEK